MKEKTLCGVEVSESVLIDRINKRLTDDSLRIKEERSTGSPSFGTFYEQHDPTDEGHDTIDLESIGRKLGVLAPGETLTRSDPRSRRSSKFSQARGSHGSL
ncbi:MAG TPA: hypothetical protein VJV05_15565 [Pyrinomonadaceae bacterium]|nr:hypothetical protein [Pyrinomonadaceae bacterium]